MTDESGEVLRRSLDAVDRHRKWMIGGLVALAVLLLLSFAYGLHSVGRSQTDAFLAHYFILLIWVTVLAVVVIMQIAAATKRILRAIELASKR